jgi:hypothetical protein
MQNFFTPFTSLPAVVIFLLSVNINNYFTAKLFNMMNNMQCSNENILLITTVLRYPDCLLIDSVLNKSG